MDQDHIHGKHCSRCGSKFTFKDWLANQGRSLVTFLCALCLSFAVGTAELSFAEIANQDQPVNSFPTNAVDFILTGTSTTVALSGDMMIDFIKIHKVEHPQKVVSVQENARPL